jgi:hypothetical protein
VTLPNRFLTQYNFSNFSRLDPEPEVSLDAVEKIGDVGSNDKPIEQVVEE